MTIKGEYWYSNDNKLYACDGDRNKFGHEGFLIYYSRKILKSAIEKKYKKKDKWGDPVKISLVNQWGSMDDSDDFKWELIEYSDEDLNPYNEDSISKLISELNKPIIDNDFFKVCFSDEYSSGEIDVVEYGIQRLKWIRIVGRDARGGIVKDIQVPELNRDYLKKTYNAIIAACYKEKKQWDLVNDIYNISTYKGQIYQIPLGDMQTSNMDALEREGGEALTNVSREKVREMDKAISPSYYKGTIGDSYKFPTFKEFLLLS
jgi:nitrogen regulatory protein PII